MVTLIDKAIPASEVGLSQANVSATGFSALIRKNGINDGVASKVLIAHDEGTYEIVQTGCSRPAGDVADGLPELHEPE